MPLVSARFDHEATHAIRFLLALHQDSENAANVRGEDEQAEDEQAEGEGVGMGKEKGEGERHAKRPKTASPTNPPFTATAVPKKTPPRPVPPGEERYKLTMEEFHSGYLVEHLKNGGVVVELRGTLKLNGEVVQADYARVRKVCCRNNADWEKMTCSVWNIDKQAFDEARLLISTSSRGRITRKDDS